MKFITNLRKIASLLLIVLLSTVSGCSNSEGHDIDDIVNGAYDNIDSLPEGVIVKDNVLVKWECYAIPSDGKVVIPKFVKKIGWCI